MTASVSYTSMAAVPDLVVGPVTSVARSAGSGVPDARELTERLQLALDVSGLGTWRWEIGTDVVEWDERLEALYGFAPGTFPGTFEAYRERIHPEDRQQMLSVVDAATRDRRPYRVEHRVLWPDGTVRWVQGSGVATVNDQGQVTGAFGCSLDVTDLMEARLELAQAVSEAETATQRERDQRRRLEFLGQVNEALADAATRHDVMEAVARTAVPRLGDWCMVYVLTDPTSAPEVVAAHADPAHEAWARDLAEGLPWDPTAPVGMPAVLRTGDPELYPIIPTSDLEDLGLSQEHSAVARRLGIHSLVGVPMVKRGRVVGGLQFVRAETGRNYDVDDLALAEAIAARVASALENRRLTDQQRQIAGTLQASLLPDRLPEIDGLDLAVRYSAAGEGTEVGGDFYDVFPNADGTWTAVIGDVCGTGPLAASQTSLARHVVRLCAQRGDDPVTALSWLNRAMTERRSGRFLTMAHVELRPEGTGVDLALTLAGHPLPVHVTASGVARLVGTPGTLLGAYDEIRLDPFADRLDAGDTLVLYTDGICDVAPPNGLSEAQVLELVADAATGADGSAAAVVERIHDRLMTALPAHKRTDDMAILVMRVRPG